MAEGTDELAVQFESAAQHIRSISGQLTAEQLLAFYARFKQCRQGPCNISKPGFFDFEGQKKWNAWKKLANMSRAQAMEEYVQLLCDIDPSWQELTKSKEVASPMGVTVSCMKNTEEVLGDDEKTLFDWVKEGNEEKVARLVNCREVNSKDEEGMGLIHWAADRGNMEVLKILLECGADINLQDGDGQTALHYAASCGHIKILQLLMEYKADQNIVDSEGMYPIDRAEDSTVQDLMGH